MTTQKKNIFFWTLYDFANSLVVLVFTLYFAQWLVVENKVSDLWYNMIFVGSSVLFLFTVPAFSGLADKNSKTIKYLRATTVLLTLATLISGTAANLAPDKMIILIAAIGFMFSNYFYQFSISLYNGILKTLASKENLGFISGLGQTANWLGHIFGILISLPLATGIIYIFGKPGRVQPLVPVTILFFLLALPMLIKFKDTQNAAKPQSTLKAEYKNFIASFKALKAYPGLLTFLLAFFFFNDAVVTSENNIAIYLEQVFQVSDNLKSLLLGSVLLTSAGGAFTAGWFSDKIGLKKSLIMVLSGWVILFPALGLASNFWIFFAFAIIMGILYGATWTVTRAIMAHLSPQENINQAFSYYTLMERFATLIGPLSWGLIVWALSDYGILKYRVAMGSMFVFVVIGMVIFIGIPKSKLEQAAVS
jgi:MFS transporter, UMF1 family